MNALLDLSNRSVLVTGASSGIGRECARLCSELGARVVIAGRDNARLEETFFSLQGVGHSSLQHDFQSAERTLDLIDQAVAAAGPLSGIVHCAGVQSSYPIRSQTVADVEELMRVNVTSCLMIAKALRRRQHHTKPASLVLISSVAALQGLAARSSYSASKGAVIALTRSLAVELSRDSIRVNCLSPGYIFTPMGENFATTISEEQLKAIENAHLLGFGSASDVAGAAAFLLANTGKWITGTNLIIDGGYTCH